MGNERPPSRLDSIDRHLRDPLKLRIALASVMLGGWYFLAFSPLTEKIAAAARDRASVETHLTLARDIEALRGASSALKDRVPQHTDTNQWAEYLLAGVRAFPVRLLRLEPQGTRKHGPFDVVLLQVELQGEYRDLDSVLAWIEGNERFLRVDTLAFQPSSGKSKGLDLKMTVVGISN